MSHAITAWALDGASVYTSEFNSRPKTQNDYKNVWICPALCNHKGMSWDISAFPLRALFSHGWSRSGESVSAPSFSSLPPSVCGDAWTPQKAGLSQKHNASLVSSRVRKVSVSQNPSRGRVSRLRSKVISNQTALWTQTHGGSRVEWTFEEQIVPRNFLFSDAFITSERLFSPFGGGKGVMINHRRNAVEELCCVYSVVFWRPRCVDSVSGGLVATWDASGCFSCTSWYSAASNTFQTCVQTRAQTEEKEEKARPHVLTLWVTCL